MPINVCIYGNNFLLRGKKKNTSKTQFNVI